MAIRNPITRLCILSFFSFIWCVPSFEQGPDTQKCGFISAGKLNIYYCEQGHGRAIFFLHAGFLDMQQWKQQVTWLAKNHRVITLDLPGHGNSTGTDTTIRIAEVINQVMNSLQIASASFVGMSLGASCAVDFALSHPERVSKLLLCSPGLSGWQDVMSLDTLSKRLFLRSDSFADTHDPELITENFVHFWLDGPYRKTAPVDSAVRGYVFRTAAAKMHKGVGIGPVFDRKKAAKRVYLIHKPVLILYGNLDIPFIVNVSLYLHKKIKGSQLGMIGGTGHLFSLEKPQLFDAYLKNWVKYVGG